MQQMLIIVPRLDKKFDFHAAKAKIAQYVGERLILETFDDSPVTRLKEPLSQEDKTALQTKVFQDNNGTMLYVTHDEDLQNRDKDYLTLSVVED